MQTKKNVFKKGFTLIELLVVVAIISLLSSVVFASLGSARAKARDARRKSDLHTLEVAILSYYTDRGIFPSDGNTYNGVPWTPQFSSDLITNNYISSMPIDPLNTSVYNGHWYIAGRTSGVNYGQYATCSLNGHYLLFTELEAPGGSYTRYLDCWNDSLRYVRDLGVY